MDREWMKGRGKRERKQRRRKIGMAWERRRIQRGVNDVEAKSVME